MPLLSSARQNIQLKGYGTINAHCTTHSLEKSKVPPRPLFELFTSLHKRLLTVTVTYPNYGSAALIHEIKLHSKLQGALLRVQETGQRNASNFHLQLDF